MKRKWGIWCIIACLLVTCISVPSVTAKADYIHTNTDGSDENDTTDSSAADNGGQDDTPQAPDLSQVTITPASQTGFIQENPYAWWQNCMPEYKFTLNSTTMLNAGDETIDFSCESSNENITVKSSLENNVVSITPSGLGKTKVTITINEKTFTVTIHTIRVKLPNSLLLTPKQTKTVSSQTAGVKAKWSSSDPSVASVSSGGKIKAKKTGNTFIKLQVGDYMFGCVVSVVTPAKKSTVQIAAKIGSTCQYSQPKRMQKKYYDCSSLVWKAYHNNGVNFGGTWNAPVAADIAKWCVQHDKIIKGGLTEKSVKNLKVNPGDMIFKTGADNGRYKGIYHVEMITGYVFYGFDEKGKEMIGLQWATGTEKYYPVGQMLARP